MTSPGETNCKLESSKSSSLIDKILSLTREISTGILVHKFINLRGSSTLRTSINARLYLFWFDANQGKPFLLIWTKVHLSNFFIYSFSFSNQIKNFTDSKNKLCAKSYLSARHENWFQERSYQFCTF